MLVTIPVSHSLIAPIFSPPNIQFSFPTSLPINPFHPKTPPLHSKSKPSLPPNRFPPPRHLRPQSSLFNAEQNPNNDEDPSIIEAREAVSEILQEFGLSKDESLDIALNSPKYVKILIDGVRDLDELSLWNSYRSESEDGERSILFKDKVIYLAKQKGDKGLIPFLESVGLNPLSSTHVARYLASESLPKLIRKVKYVRDILFSGSDSDEYIGKNARRMMTQLSISVEEDIQQTLSYFQKTEARRGGLKMLSNKDTSLRYLIESFPRLLLLSVETHLEPLVRFLEGVGVPKQRIGVIFLLFPPIIFYNIGKDVRPRFHLFEKVGAKEKDVGKMLLKYPWILSTNIQENYEEILTFFGMEKVPKVSVDKAIKSWPHLLGCSISRMEMMVEQFVELDVRSEKLGQIIASSPQLLLRKPQEFVKVVSFMEELDLDYVSIGRILSRCPEIFTANVEKTLRKKVKFLLDIGILEDQLPRVIRKYPELLVCGIEKAMLPRVMYLLEIGLSKGEVASMVKRFSPLLGYSIDMVLRPKLEFLLVTMKKQIGDVVQYPRYFSYNLDEKIKPRFWVLKGRNLDVSLEEMLGKNDEEFAADFMGIGSMLIPPATLQENNILSE